MQKLGDELKAQVSLRREWFHAAREGKDERVAEFLAQQPELVDLEDIGKYTALHHAAFGGHEKVTARLIAARPTLINEGNFLDETPLDAAAAKGHDKIVAQMLATNLVRVGSLTIGLYQAVKEGHAKVIELLLAVRPSLVTATDRTVIRTLFYAAEAGHDKVVLQLLAACPDLVLAVDSGGSNVLHRAAKHGNDNLVAQLLAVHPEMISVVDNTGWNVLMHAVHKGHQHIAEQLLAIKPDLMSHVSQDGDTTLLHAVMQCNDNPQFVAKLWRMNPQALTQANFHSLTPFYFCVLLDKQQLISLFQWSLSFDDIVTAYNQCQISHEERYRPVMEQQCEALLESLNQDVAGTVFEYLGFEPVKRPARKN